MSKKKLPLNLIYDNAIEKEKKKKIQLKCVYIYVDECKGDRDKDIDIIYKKEEKKYGREKVVGEYVRLFRIEIYTIYICIC